MHAARLEDEKVSLAIGTGGGVGRPWLAEGEPLEPGQPRRPPVTSPRDEGSQSTEQAPGSESGPVLRAHPSPRDGEPAPRPDLEWCPVLPEKDPAPPSVEWKADPCALLSSEGRAQGGTWGPETPLLTDPKHPDHALYEQALSQLRQPGLCDRFNSQAQMARAAAAIAAEAKEAGLRRIDDVVVGTDGGKFIAIEGPNPYAPEARRAAVDYREALTQSVEQSTAKVTPEACRPGPGGPGREGDLLSALVPPSESIEPARSSLLR
ncbi:MAG: XVIPCD domain-containing protein [Pseudomonadota bacterium]